MIYLWKDWKEQSRGKGIWLSLGILILISVFILLQARVLPADQGFQVFLLSLHQMNVYILPILNLFMSSFSMIQEREQKTLLILLTKKESFLSFLVKKSVSIQLITLGVFIGWYFLLAIPSKLFFEFNAGYFLAFLVSVISLILIFNQIGILWGSICSSRMQVVGANLFTWFFFIFLFDLISLFYLPHIHYDNVKTFSFFYFIDMVHTLNFYLETQLNLFPLEHMSRMMEKMVWLPPSVFLLIDLFFWIGLSFLVAMYLGRKGNEND